MTKPTIGALCPAETQISLDIHLPSLIRVFTVHLKKSKDLCYHLGEQVAKADLCLRSLGAIFK